MLHRRQHVQSTSEKCDQMKIQNRFLAERFGRASKNNVAECLRDTHKVFQYSSREFIPNLCNGEISSQFDQTAVNCHPHNARHAQPVYKTFVKNFKYVKFSNFWHSNH